MDLSPPPPPAALAAVLSKAVVQLLFIYCFIYFPLFVRVLCLSFFCYALLRVHSSYAIIILKRKRKRVALLLLSYRCIVTIICFVALPRGTSGWSAVCDYGIS